MLGAMRELWGRAQALTGKPEAVEERLALIRQASAEAHKAAVYVHPRLASVDAEGEESGAVAAGIAAGKAAGVAVELLGSRELARRLLFVVACAEQGGDGAAAKVNRRGAETRRGPG